MVDLGTTGRGDPVLMNKYVFDCDIPILIGHTQGNPYGGYSGGYKHCATGITHWRSIASHHVPKVMHRDDFTPVSGKSLMRTKFDEIGMWMEEKMGHPFHGFSMMSCGHIAEMNTAAIYIVGAQEPGIARGMGLKTRAAFEEALEDAKKKFVGPDPNILALPKTFQVGAVHLCMKDQPYDGTNGCGGCGC